MKKFIVILDGPMGSGKSTIGAKLAEGLKRTALVHEDRIKWFISDFRRSTRDNAIARAVFIAMCKEYLKQGINLVIAQGFLKNRRSLGPFISMAKKEKFELLIYHLNAPRDILLERIQKRKKPEEIKTPIAKTRVHRNIARWKSYRYAIGKEFQTDKMSVANVVREILKDVGFGNLIRKS